MIPSVQNLFFFISTFQSHSVPHGYLSPTYKVSAILREGAMHTRFHLFPNCKSVLQPGDADDTKPILANSSPILHFIPV